MIYVNEDINFKNAISDTYEVSVNELILKVASPDFTVRTSYGVDFQPTIKSFTKKKMYTHNNVILFPLIPQYFHNFFELFTKMIRLKELKEDFTALIIFDKDEYIDNVFSFLYRRPDPQNNDAIEVNAAHIKDFLEYAKIPFECILSKDIEKIKPKNTYLFFDDGEYMNIDPIYNYKDKVYRLSHFLKVPATHVIKQQLESVRNFFPKFDIIKNKKIWASRKATWDRKCDFEDGLENIVKDLGYEIVYFEFVPLLDQIKQIQTAEFFGCLYGSGLVNTLFMNPGSVRIAIKYVPDYDVDTYKVLNKNEVKTHVIGAYEDESVLKWLENNIGYITEVGED